MPNWKLTLSYDGSAFHGWQVQPGLPTIQGTLADSLRHITGESVLPQGSGRTDAGVHALAQVVSVDLTVPIPAPNLLRALNRALPPSIRVLSAEPVATTFHARHSALRKTYQYRILYRSPGEPESICSPFLAPFVWDCPFALSPDLMQAAAAHLLGTHDFTSFAACDPDLTLRSSPTAPGINPIKTIYASTLTVSADTLTYTITGSGFLHHMVRNIVGTLVEVGRGAIPADAITTILAARSRTAAGPTAPASGLFLVAVEYPAEYLETP